MVFNIVTILLFTSYFVHNAVMMVLFSSSGTALLSGRARVKGADILLIRITFFSSLYPGIYRFSVFDIYGILDLQEGGFPE